MFRWYQESFIISNFLVHCLKNEQILRVKLFNDTLNLVNMVFIKTVQQEELDIHTSVQSNWLHSVKLSSCKSMISNNNLKGHSEEMENGNDTWICSVIQICFGFVVAHATKCNQNHIMIYQ